MKHLNKLGNIIEQVPRQWAAHINPYEFTCTRVFELLVRKTIVPIYDSSGKLLLPEDDDAEPEAEPLAGDEASPECSDASDSSSTSGFESDTE